MISETFQMLQQAGLRPPRMLTFAITGACNLSCHHCWVDAGLPASAAHVPADTVRRLIEEYAALGGEGVRLTGGEPLCHPNCLEFLRLGRSAGFGSLALQTNGVLLSDQVVEALRELDFPGLTIQVSFDGATSASHDLVRGEGAFEGMLQGIRRLALAGLGGRVSIFFTEMRHNLAEIPSLLELAERLGVGSVVTGTLVRCGRAAGESHVEPAGVDQYQSLWDRYGTDDDFRERYHRIGKVAALEWWRAADAQRQECCTFIENPYLTSRGRLYPCSLCHADPFSVTGVFAKGLAAACAEGVALWSALLEQSARRSDEIEQCRECGEKLTCGAGCPGRAWGSCGDIMAPDDRCDLRRLGRR